MTSIRRNLLFLLMLGMLTGTGIAGFSLYWLSQKEIGELFDYQIRQTALSLSGHRPVLTLAPGDEDPAEDNVAQVWNAQGQLLLSSSPSRALPAYPGNGLQTVSFQQQRWRLYRLQSNDRFIQVAQPMVVRNELAAELAVHMLIPFCVLIPLLAGLIWWVVGRSLRPLQLVANIVATRHADAMQTLDETDLPQEIRPIIVALNQLLTRLEQAMQAQRMFIADAAHELRTPLTALKLQLQLTERAANHAQRVSGYAKLHQRIDRSIHLVRQLLTLARSESLGQAQPFNIVNLTALAKEVVQELAPLAAARQTQLRLDIAGDVSLPGDLESLRSLISNLLDNAIRYSPIAATVDIRLQNEASGVLLCVADNGSGILAEARERVFDRFYRCPGSEVMGSGLGLAIARMVVDAHGATIALSEQANATGLLVTVQFPRPSDHA